ncbi:class I SAM-dependent methyltransferase [Rubrivivax albus]|nr:class I SAM-dependent methyltransferase [Rubrivivax albus]
MLELLTLAVASAALALCAVVLHKVRRLHVASYQIADDAAAARRETEALFGQLQAADALRRLLQLEAPLPAMRGWAGSPDFLLHLARALLDQRPEAVLECSSGASTVISARCLQLNARGHVWSLEHDATYAEKTRAMLKEHGLQDWATVLHAPLRARSGEAPWYDDSVLPDAMPPVGTLVIDGPPESTAPQARAPALPRLKSRLAPGARIFVDDADRPAEQAMVAAW